ncbi:MAG: hypothetical protein ACXVAY_18020 [Mucilaginibacter sp.]
MKENNALPVKSWYNDIANLLRTEMQGMATVAFRGQSILINIRQVDFEHRLGMLLQQIYHLIEQHFPDREDHLSVIIRDIDLQNENIFKVWKPT